MILITIVSRDIYELIPIIFEFKNSTTKHVVIYDDKDKPYASRLKNSIGSFCNDIELIELDEDSKSDMLSIQNRIITTFEDEQIYLNATNADMSLMVVLSGVVLHTGGKIIAYDKFENSYNLIDSQGFSNHNIENNMQLENFMDSLGYKLTKEAEREDILSHKDFLITLFEDFGIFFKIRRYLLQDRLSTIAASYSKQIKALKELKVIDANFKGLKHISYFGTLFEEFIYIQLLPYDFDDIKIGAVLLFDSQKDEPNDIEIFNEFDILAIKDNHIYTIECKLGDNISPQEIIYKSDSLLGYFGDDSKNIIINIYPDNSHKLHKPNILFGKNAKLRAITNSIEIYNAHNFSSKKFHKKLNQFFHIEKRIFLLGGYDLEMKSIKKLLDRYSQKYIDHNLSWGAKLSSYRHDITNNNYIYIAIELIEDIKSPKNYISIDHHNDMQHKKSSLEQVANMLGVKLTRKEKLIALNDSGYIPAMREYGATSDEIDEIRKKDRKAQGVSKEDEKLAIDSIANRKKENGILIIEALTPKFSAIVDRLYGEDILIYNDNKLNYYGKNVEKVVNKFKDLVDQKKAYYGGGFGFFGLSEGSFTKEEIIHFKNKILKIQKK